LKKPFPTLFPTFRAKRTLKGGDISLFFAGPFFPLFYGFGIFSSRFALACDPDTCFPDRITPIIFILPDAVSLLRLSDMAQIDERSTASLTPALLLYPREFG
jgi:hypothetical protein